MNLKDFIRVYDNTFSDIECKKIIDVCDSEYLEPGKTVGSKGLRVSHHKKCLEVALSNKNIDRTLENFVYERLKEKVNNYMHFLYDTFSEWYPLPEDMRDTGYIFKKYIPNESWFDWHSDDAITSRDSQRTFALILYLNDVEEGGCTEFNFGYEIKPKQGSLVIFPVGFLFSHRGQPPISGIKYCITSFVVSQCCSFI